MEPLTEAEKQRMKDKGQPQIHIPSEAEVVTILAANITAWSVVKKVEEMRELRRNRIK